MALPKITEKPVSQSLADLHVLVTQQVTENGVTKEAVRRVPLSVFLAEVFDARTDNVDETTQEAHVYNSLGDFLRSISAKIASADLDIDFSDLDFLEEDDVLYLYDKRKELRIGEGWTIKGGGGGGSATGAIMKLANTTGSTTIAAALGQSVTVTCRFSSVDDEDKQPTGDGSGVYTLNGTVVATPTLPQGNISYTIPAASLVEGSNMFSIQVTDTYGTTKTLTWTITVKAISVTTNIDESLINSGSLTVRYTPIGSEVEKTTHFEVDGTEIGTAVTSDTNLAKSYTIPAQTHGAHAIRIWTTATIGGVVVSSPVLSYDLVWATDGTTTPIISVKSFGAAVQYTALDIPWMVYDPVSTETAVTLSVDGTQVASLSVGRSIQHWNYRPAVAGNHTLSITCGSVTKEFTVPVAASGITVSEITDGLLWKFDPSGRSNAEANRAAWSDNGVSMQLSPGFHWSSGGWGTDENGYPCFTVPAGDSMTITAQPFTSDWKRSGHHLKMVFKATKARRYDAQVISCMSDGIGFLVNANEAQLTTEQSSVTAKLCEEHFTELEFNVTGSGNFREMQVWLQGVLSGSPLYATNDSFIQATPVNITIGSQDCDVRIYKLREYETSLTDEELFSNWIADAPSGQEMSDRWTRNQVVDDYGNLDPERLAAQSPDLHVFVMTCPRFTTSKKDTVQGCTVRHLLSSGGTAHAFTATDVEHKGQGTSSDNYGDSARNVDFKFTSGFSFDNGTTSPVYAMTENSIGVSYLNFKANVASSENINNAMLTREYQTFNPYLRAARQADSRVRDTMEFHPAVLFVQDLSGELFGDTKVHFYAAGDIGNSKKNYEAQGLTGNNPNECIVEMSNNTADQNRWKSDDLSEETWDGKKALEFRYPENPTPEMKAAWQRVLSWVVATDTTQATNAALPNGVTYGGTTYRLDSVAYRTAKFIHEFDDYFVSNSIVFYTLFTNRHTMVDNRAKNTFWHTEDLIHWDLCFDYDNDTASGNDNEGGLTLRYGLEDTDIIGTKSVFNAADSVLFRNVQDFLGDRLVSMYQNRENAGAWSSSRYLAALRSYRSAKPERLINADMRRKYLRPYEENGTTSYLPMLHGTRELQLEQYETLMEQYMASKYMSSFCTTDSNTITLRGYTPTEYGNGITPSGDLEITMYADCYVVVQYGSNIVQQRAQRGQTVQITCPVPTMNDTEIYLRNARYIQGLGGEDGLAALYSGYNNFSTARKLQSLVLSPMDADYSNTNMTNIDLSNCPLLEHLEICGCPNLAVPLDFSGCPSLKELDLRGTGVTGVTFATGGRIQTVKLPATVASIAAKQEDDFDTLQMEGTDALRSLILEYCAALNSLNLAVNAPGLTRIRMLGVNWTAPTSEAIMNLSQIGGIDDNGFDTARAVITGQAHIGSISETRINTLGDIFPELAITYDELAAEHTITFYSDDGVTVLDVQHVEHGTSGVNPITRARNPIPTPTKPSTTYLNYTFSGWVGSYTNVVQDMTVTAAFASSTRTYTVTRMNGLDPVQVDTVDAGSAAPAYSGTDLEQTGRIWTGWDREVAEVLADVTINATFITPVLPEEKLDLSQYDFIYSDDDNDNAAYTFAEFAGIIITGQAAEYFSKWKLIKINNSGTAVTDACFVFELHSFKHYRLAADRDSFASTSWFMKGVLTQNRRIHSSNTNVGGFFGKELDTWLENTWYKRSLAPKWRSLAKAVVILTSAGNQSATIVEGERHAYLPSHAEIGFDTGAVPYKNEVDPEAAEIAFTKYTSNNARIKKDFNGEGTAHDYWTRSPHAGSASQFRYCSYSGYANSYNASTSSFVCVGLSF